MQKTIKQPAKLESYQASDIQVIKHESLMMNHTEAVKVKWTKVKTGQFVAVLTICSSILAFQTAKCVQKYRLGATGTADKYVHTRDTSFPVFTMCPSNPYHLNRLKANGIATKKEIQFGAKFISNDSSVTPQIFYLDVILSQKQLLKDVKIFTDAQVEGQNHFHLQINESVCGDKLFHTKPYYFFGDCYALKIPQCLKNAGVLEIEIIFNEKADIFIHHEDQFMSPNSRARVSVDRGHFLKIAINHEVVHMLSKKESCVESYNFAGIDDSYDDCMYARLQEVMMKDLGCTVPWLPNRSNICIEEEDRKHVFALYQKNRRNQNNICPKSCKFTNMYFGPPVTGLNSIDVRYNAKAVFYFRRDIKTTKEYYLYSFLSMLAEIGGYVSLLLGVSLFKIADMNNHVVDWLIQGKIADLESDRKSEAATSK